jgi:xanthine dehydrogenase accessory factor
MKVLVRGGGDLASGTIARLQRAGWQVVVAELAQPLAVRRYVSFAQAIYSGEISIEEITALHVSSMGEIEAAFARRAVPVIVDPPAAIRGEFAPDVIIDGRMRKLPSELALDAAPLIIGLGPGFTAGSDCHAVVETNRGARLGRVFWNGSAQADTGIPERVLEYSGERVLRAPGDGRLVAISDIGKQVQQGEAIARIGDDLLCAPFSGVIRGLLQDGLDVRKGMKVGDIDPRGDESLCWMISEKALAVGGGVLEAILTWEAQRRRQG